MDTVGVTDNMGQTGYPGNTSNVSTYGAGGDFGSQPNNDPSGNWNNGSAGLTETSGGNYGAGAGSGPAGDQGWDQNQQGNWNQNQGSQGNWGQDRSVAPSSQKPSIGERIMGKSCC